VRVLSGIRKPRTQGARSSSQPKRAPYFPHIHPIRLKHPLCNPAYQRTSLSFRPCLPCCQRNYSQQVPFALRTLLRFFATTASPPPSRLRPTSGFSRLYGLPCSGNFSPGREGLLQLLGMSLSSCCRFHPTKGCDSRISQFSATHAAFTLQLQARPSELLTFEATSPFTLRYGLVTRRRPDDDAVDGLQRPGFPGPLPSKLRGF
jgi:hypothetical protein